MAAKRMYVYFVQAGEEGPIKIGRSRNPAARIKDLQISTDRPLKVRLVLEGRGLEGELHRQFAGIRGKGEWFFPCESLLDFIRERAADHVDPDTIGAAAVEAESDRNALIILAATRHGWSTNRLATVFGISTRHVRRILKDYRTGGPSPVPPEG